MDHAAILVKVDDKVSMDAWEKRETLGHTERGYASLRQTSSLEKFKPF